MKNVIKLLVVCLFLAACVSCCRQDAGIRHIPGLDGKELRPEPVYVSEPKPDPGRHAIVVTDKSADE
jgi:hypothetical protein